jgi:cytochrome c oxidase assembly protein subunit 15
MAGTRAGFMYSTWPDMNGVYVPDGMTLTNHVGIHFVHRTLGYVVGLAGLGLWWATRRRATSPAQRRGGRWVAALVVVQVALGITTILLNGRLHTYHGLHPLHIAVAAAHQGVALLLLTAGVYLAHAFGRRPRAAEQPAPSTGHLQTSTDPA